MKEYDLFTLNNGIRIIHKEVSGTKVHHCGLMLDIGSRDENPEEEGLAHFWEHMAFKGTNKRKAFHILNSLDSVGGELNAYTTKEKICFYASVLDRFSEKAFELITDITFNSIFPEKQITRERQVILEEMAMYQDTPEDAIQDEFDEQIFVGHPLAHNILGTEKNVKRFKHEDFNRFIDKNLDTSKVVFTSVGNVPLKKIIRLAEKYLAPIPIKNGATNRKLYEQYKPKHISIKKNLMQAHCAIGRPAYTFKSKNRLPFYMLTSLLGGASMNTRLNMALREKLGYVYSVEANYSSYTDTGLFAIYFGTEKKNLTKSTSVVYRELKKLRQKKLGVLQLHKLKEQLMGQLAMSDENNTSLMLGMGRSLLDMGKVQSLEEVFEKMKIISSEEIFDLANEMFEESQLSTLKYIPES